MSASRSSSTELFAAFPDDAFALSEIVVGPQGVFEVATLTGTNQGSWARVEASGLRVALEVLILFPWDPPPSRCSGERHLVRPRVRNDDGSNGDVRRIAPGGTGPPRWPYAAPAYPARSRDPRPGDRPLGRQP